ncbi:response regulator [Candidatus Woesearchaeota archaeon]|nr:response regulator [Candidatus Woesearchaeota archaeon]
MAKRVLIVEHIKAVRDALEHRIKELAPDTDVVTASQAEDVLSRVVQQGERYDLLLVDNLTESSISGAEAIRQLRNAGITTPAYLLSSGQISQYAQHVGATGVFIKEDVKYGNGSFAEEVRQHLL